MNWTLYELFINVFQGFLYTWFITKNLTPGPKYSKFAFILCGLLTAASLSTYLFFPMPEWDSWTLVFIIIYSVIFLKGSLVLKLFWNMIMIIVVGGIPGIWFHITNLFLNVNTETLLQQTLPRIIFTISGNLVLFLTFLLITLSMRHYSRNETSSALLMIISLLCAFLIDTFFTLHNQDNMPTHYLFICCGTCLIIAILTLFTHKTILDYGMKEQEYRYREKLLKEIGTQAEGIKDIYNSMLKLRHDMNAYIKDLDSMILSDNLDEVPAYFEKMKSQMTPLFNSGNISLDSVLTVKLNKLRRNNIEFKPIGIHYTGGMNISDINLCSLISNMIDNACEAMILRKDIPGEHYVLLHFSFNPGGMMIICENPTLGLPPKANDKKLFSVKTEPLHGLGISIMEKIVQEAGGQFDIIYSKDMFRIIVLIPPATDAVSD